MLTQYYAWTYHIHYELVRDMISNISISYIFNCVIRVRWPLEEWDVDCLLFVDQNYVFL